MNHQEMLKTHAAERYLLGEMDSTERELFERHLFDCQECAEEVRAALVLADNVKAVCEEDARRAAAPVRSRRTAERRNWFGWLKPAWAVPLAAGVALVALTAYQSLVVIPRLRGELAQATAPRALPAVMLRPMARGDTVVRVGAADRFFQLTLDVNADRSFASYDCELQREGGVLFTIAAPAPPPGMPLSLLVPASRLRPGPYTLVVRGRLRPGAESGPEVGRYNFEYQHN
jgi:hypothetical protein